MIDNKTTTQQFYTVYWTERDEWGVEDREVRYLHEAGARVAVSALKFRGHREAFYETSDGQRIRH